MDVVQRGLYRFCIVVGVCCSGCGTASDSPQDQLPESSQTIVLDGTAVILEASPFLNQMPGIVLDPNSPPPCMSLIVPADLDSGSNAFPSRVIVKRISIRQSGVEVWAGEPSSSETGVHGNKLGTVARGCPPESIQPGAIVKVVVEVVHQGSSYFVHQEDIPVFAAV